MDELFKQVGAWLVAQGPMGILVLASWFALYKVWGLFLDATQKRFEERAESTKALADNAHALEKLTEAIVQGRLTSNTRGRGG